MKNRCEHYRELMADAMTSELAQSDRAALEEHLDRCEACARFMRSLRRDDRLLLGYVHLLKHDISDIKTDTRASLEGIADTPVRDTIPQWRGLMKLRYVAVVVIIFGSLWAVGRISGVFDGSTPAIASVLAEIEKARDVSYRLVYRVEGVDPFETRDFANDRGIQRKEYRDIGTVTIRDPVGGKKLQINRNVKKATLTYRVGEPAKESLGDYLDWVQTLHKRSASFAGVETIDGRKTHLFVNEEDIYYLIRVWVDPETDLPVKTQFVSIPNPSSDIISPRIVLMKHDFGGDPSESRVISYRSSGGITNSATVTMEDFVWNAGLDDSLFSMVVPDGHELEIDSLDVSEDGERNLIDALALWTDMAGDTFPDDINDLGISEKAAPLLITAYNGDGDPEREFDRAYAAANALCKGCVFAQEMKVAGDWHYRGTGLRAGDPHVPVCWWREQDAELYRIVYADLHIDDIREKDLPDR